MLHNRLLLSVLLIGSLFTITGCPSSDGPASTECAEGDKGCTFGDSGQTGGDTGIPGEVFPPNGLMPSGWQQSAAAIANWYVDDTTTAHEGQASLRSADINDGQLAGIEMTSEFNAGTVSFFYKVDSEQGFDYLFFYIDDVLTFYTSGNIDWTEFTTSITAGVHTLRWEYNKDSNISDGQDTAWIDSVDLPVVVSDTFPPLSGGVGVIPNNWNEPNLSNVSWQVDGNEAFEGNYSLRSGDILDDQRSIIEFRNNFTGGDINFAYKVSSEEGWDFFNFYIDGVRQLSNSGEVNWQQISFTVPAGLHNLRWEYDKDNTTSSGSDAAWIDAVTLPITNTNPAATWSLQSTMPNARNAHSSTAVNGLIYVFGGNNNNDLNNVDVYNPATDSWASSVSTLPTFRRTHASSALGNQIYVIGGGNSDATATYSSVDVYNTSINTWSTAPNLPAERSLLTSTNYNNRIYVFGGVDSAGTQSASTYEFNPSTNSWNTLASMTMARDAATSVELNGEIYVIGGWDGSSNSSVVEKFNPSTNSWTTAASLSTPRSYAVSGVIGGQIYVAGGYDGAGWLSSMEVYNPSSNTWTASDAMIINRSAASASVVDNKLYVFGGWNGSTYISSVEEYQNFASTVPSAPTNVTATGAYSAATISWDSVAGANGYVLYYATTPGVTPANYGTLGGGRIQNVASPYIHAGLTNNTTYYYVVTAVNSAGESTYSTEVSADPTFTSPQTPGNVQLTPGDGQITVSWDPVAGATEYEVFQATYSTVTSASYDYYTTTVSTSYIDTNVFNDTTYYYVVRARNTYGSSLLSSVISATPSAATSLPGRPNNVTAAAGDGQVTISWDPVSGASNYNLYMATYSGVSTSSYTMLHTNVTSPYTHTALTNGTTYYFVVTAVNSFGESAVSLETSATPAAIPSAPTNVQAIAGDGSITLSWNTVAGATSYNYYIATSSGLTPSNYGSLGGWFTNTSGSPVELTGLTNGATYYAIVTAVNNAGESAASLEVNATPFVFSPPANLTATSGDQSIALSWDAVAEAESYRVYYASFSGVSNTNYNGWINAASNSATVSNLTNGITYYFVVTSYKGSTTEESSISTETSAIPGLTPPSHFTAVSGDGSVDLSWDLVPGATNYTIYYSTLPGVTTTTNQNSVSIAGNTSLVSVPSLTNDVTYYFVITTLGPSGQSVISNEITAVPHIAWTNGTGMFTLRVEHSSEVIDGKIYTFGGDAASNNQVESYDPQTDTWLSRTVMPTGAQSSTADTVNGKAYVIGGYSPVSLHLNYVQEYDPVNDSWLYKTNMPTARNLAVSETVNGKIYVIGGFDGSNFLDTVEMYDPATNIWTSKTSMPTARGHATSAVIDGKIYVIAGANISGWNNVVESYDPVTDSWTTLSDMPGSIRTNRAVSSVIDSKIYVTAGNVNTTAVFDPATETWSTSDASGITSGDYTANTVNGRLYVIGQSVNRIYTPPTVTRYWTSQADLNTQRYNAASAVANGKIYTVGGYNSTTGQLNSLENFDPATSSWTPLNSLVYAVNSLSLTNVNGMLYAIGGFNGATDVNYIQRYDTSITSNWALYSSISTARSEHCSVGINGKIYISGGYSNSSVSVLSDLIIYDPIANTEAPAISSMSTARHFHACAEYNGKLYVSGGRDAFSTLSSVEVYDPATNSWSIVASMNNARYGQQMTNINGKLYVTGGYDGTGNIVETTEVYDPVSNTWTTSASMPIPMTLHNSVNINGSLFVIGGYNTTIGTLSTLYSFE